MWHNLEGSSAADINISMTQCASPTTDFSPIAKAETSFRTDDNKVYIAALVVMGVIIVVQLLVFIIYYFLMQGQSIVW